MATDTAAPAPTPAAGPDPTRHVWQVPTFLLGAAAFVAAWQGWLPLGTPDPDADLARDVAALRAACEKVKPDRDELRQLLGSVQAGVDARGGGTPAHRFALGSGYARLAELTPAADEARQHWVTARGYFDRVRGEELRDPGDAPKFAFRAAKARAAAGLPPNVGNGDLKLYLSLLAKVPAGEEAGEAGRLSGELALRLSPPDVAAAREAFSKYLTGTGVSTPPAALARAKLQLAELHHRLREFDLARKWLEQIGADAPPEVVGPAKALLARVRMADGDWAGAARDWEAARAAPGLAPAARASAAYFLGVCRLNTKETDAAAKGFEEAVTGGGPEGRAAAVRLAELHLRGPDRAKREAAAGLLAAAVKDGPAAGFQNPHLSADDARPVFELAVTTLVADGAFEAAVRAADAYAAVAAGGRDRERRAEALAAWAAALRKESGEFKPKAAAAAAEFEALVGLQPAPAAKAEVARKAAGMYVLAGETGKAVAVLEAAARLPDLPDATSGAVWAELAEALLAAGRPDEVWKAINQAMASVGPVGTATRYRIARQFLDAKNPGLATLGRNLLGQIADGEAVGPAEQEVHESTLVELARDAVRAGDYPGAEARLRKQVGTYPAGPQAGVGRLLLGVCLVQRAAGGGPAPPDAAAAVRMREEALDLFKQIVADADARYRRDGKLSDQDAWLRLQAGMRVLQALHQLGRPNDVLAEAAGLLEKHRGTVEELVVLSLVYHAFKQKNEPGKALQTRDRMKELFDRLPAAAFPAASGEYSRGYWEKVWFAPEPK
ncbi:MAG: hypothetical protein C0501_20295 [Isosphaera sp.]|nr:hypothetical protein [Isosphaera sp.]